MILSLILLLIGLVTYGLMVAFNEDYRFEVASIGLLVIFVLWIPLCCLPLYIQGFQYETGRGEHTGYITAVQKQGMFYKTGRAYVKTDTQSSQEDAYCVIDDNVYKQLEQLSKSKTQVTIKYFSWFQPGIKNCEGEDDIIYQVQ